MTPLSDALTAARYRQGELLVGHCSNCKAYAATSKPGEGRCAENEGAAVSFEGLCDKWKAR